MSFWIMLLNLWVVELQPGWKRQLCSYDSHEEPHQLPLRCISAIKVETSQHGSRNSKISHFQHSIPFLRPV